MLSAVLRALCVENDIYLPYSSRNIGWLSFTEALHHLLSYFRIRATSLSHLRHHILHHSRHHAGHHPGNGFGGDSHNQPTRDCTQDGRQDIPLRWIAVVRHSVPPSVQASLDAS